MSTCPKCHHAFPADGGEHNCNNAGRACGFCGASMEASGARLNHQCGQPGDVPKAYTVMTGHAVFTHELDANGESVPIAQRDIKPDNVIEPDLVAMLAQAAADPALRAEAVRKLWRWWEANTPDDGPVACSHKTFLDHTDNRQDGANLVWQCGECGGRGLWGPGWSYLGNEECSACGVASIESVRCPDCKPRKRAKP